MDSGPGADAPGRPDPAGPWPATGDSRVDDAVSQLDDLAGLPVAEHPEVFERVHQRLTEALGDVGAAGERAAMGDRPGQAGG